MTAGSGRADQPITADMSDILAVLENEELRIFGGQIQEARARAQTAATMLIVNEAFTFLVLLGAAYQFNRDLTRRQHADRALREAIQAADAANLAKTQFLATVSHEFRTPLHAISGMSELLLETRLDSEQAEFARSVQVNAQSLGMLIGDLLDSSKIEAGQVDLQPEPFDLRELIEGVAELLVVRAEGKGVDLIVDLPPEGPWHLVGDYTRLRQVLMNLVGNAVKFTAEGEVAIRAQVSPSTDGRTANVEVRVSDTGIGVAPEAQGRIFERFVQADPSTVTRFGGTGLGLNISRSLLGLMGGQLSVDSKLGQGSTFRVVVTLPLAVQPPAAFDRSSLAGLELVVVEVNTTQRAASARTLEYAGAVVRAFATADAARAAITNNTAVIVVGESQPGAMTLDFVRAVSWPTSATATVGRPTSAEGTADRRVVPLVLMCSLRSMMASHIGTHGIAACVYTPVKQAVLVETVRLAASGVFGPAVSTADADAPHAGRPTRARLLLVEDHRDNSILATRVLTSAGYAVDLAEDGLAAVERAAAVRYDLILMDLLVATIDGVEAARRIRARERESGLTPVPMVATTAHAMATFRNEALWAGMNDYITKPVQRKSLLAICERWIARRPAAAPDQALPLPSPGDRFIAVEVDDDIADLLPGYVSARKADVVTLRTLLAAHDFEGIRDVAHKLKGSGDGYGLPFVSEGGRLLGKAAAAADVEAVRHATETLDRNLSRLRIRAAGGRAVVEP